MRNTVMIGEKFVGENYPVYIIAEIGLNHNGNIEIAKELIDVAKLAGCDAVKFQKRTPEICVPVEQRNLVRETPWGKMTYLEYRHKVEFGYNEYAEINEYCKEKGIHWFASCWDVEAIDFIEQFNPVCYKIASASITNIELLEKLKKIGKPIILSTGMSTFQEIKTAVSMFDEKKLIILHTTSTYPCKPEEINLKMITTLKRDFNSLVGYSGHEVGLQISLAAVALGAAVLERHITLDRSMWGSDQAASVEPQGLIRLVRDIRIIEKAFGDGIKKLYESEIPIKNKLRG